MDYNLHKDSTLHLVLRLRGGMRTIFMALMGSTVILDVDAGDTVDDVKGQDSGQEGILPDQRRLIFMGKHVDSGCTPSDYRIQDESTLHSVLRLCGGMLSFVTALTGTAIALDRDASDTMTT